MELSHILFDTPKYQTPKHGFGPPTWLDFSLILNSWFYDMWANKQSPFFIY